MSTIPEAEDKELLVIRSIFGLLSSGVLGGLPVLT